MKEIVERVLGEINSQGTSDDEAIQAFADELAGGVDAEREMEIAIQLPRGYTRKELLSAEEGERVLLPRMLVVSAHKLPGKDWHTSTTGRGLRRRKEGCVVGVHTVVDNEHVTSLHMVVLWQRLKK